MRRFLFLVFVLLMPAMVWAEERFPLPDFTGGHVIPDETKLLPVPRAEMWGYRGWVDIAALAVALSLSAWLVLKKRSRRGVFLLMIASLIYFGFWRKGCVCPIGSIQNVAYAIGGGGHCGYVLSWVVAAYFVLPLAFTLFFGRVFCSGVCPLGAIQDAVIWKPIQLPRWVDEGVGLFAYAYLGVAVLLAAKGSRFAICQFDPFVGFFRMSGPVHMIFLGSVILAMGMFVGRIYCRFICPYSVLMRLLTPFAWWRVTITPPEKACVNCRLCEQSCPFGAIRLPTQGEGGRARIERRDRVWWLVSVLLVVALSLLLAWLGYGLGPQMARLDPTVRLASVVQLAESVSPEKRTEQQQQIALMDEYVKVFRESGQPVAELYAQAAAIQKRFASGTAWFGVWMGLVISLKLLGTTIRRKRVDYTVASASCLSCARCYKLCVVEEPLPGGTAIREVRT
ncbi:MAG: 4Fe-4S binding protein [Phycisphaerales bacterium]|nr:4Fe-4S binding protein [Phycisphaerales bacterium]